MATDRHATSDRHGSGGAVLAADGLAAAVGADILRKGGTAADAAVATALALAVVDPANCGIGGYGGFAVVDPGGVDPVVQVCFNTSAPAVGDVMRPGRMPAGAIVAPPAVVAGLGALHRRYGRLDSRQVWAPAIRLARDGFRVGRGLEIAFAWAKHHHPNLNQAFKRIFFRHGEALRRGEMLRQPELAESLERIASNDGDLIRVEGLVESICNEVGRVGGFLTEADFEHLRAEVSEAAMFAYSDAEIWAPDPAQCGAQVLFVALESLNGAKLAAQRDRVYVDALAAALSAGAASRNSRYEERGRARSQTSHLCTVDGGGMVVSMTFTHGPTWFGSGLVAGETGLLLNAGAYLFVRRRQDNAVVAVPHLCPIVLRRGPARYALGTPGGWRIPAIVLQAIVDLIHFDVPLERIFHGARLSLDRRGLVEVEEGLGDVIADLRTPYIDPDEYYGPSGALGFTQQGVQAGLDPRFDGRCVYVGRDELGAD